MSRAFSNRRTPPTDADFACPPGIQPGARLPDWQYMDEDLQIDPKNVTVTVFGVSTPIKPGKSPGIEPQARDGAVKKATQHQLFDF